MNSFKSWVSSGLLFYVVSALWFLTWLLGFTTGNASSSVWMFSVAVLFFILGISQTAQASRRSRS